MEDRGGEMSKERQAKYAEWIDKLLMTVNWLLRNADREIKRAPATASMHIEHACELNRIAIGLNAEVRQMLRGR